MQRSRGFYALLLSLILLSICGPVGAGSAVVDKATDLDGGYLALAVEQKVSIQFIVDSLG